MIKSITNFLIIFFIFQQIISQISKIDQNGYNPFCDETLQIIEKLLMNIVSIRVIARNLKLQRREERLRRT